jgi:hypothetical protein
MRYIGVEKARSAFWPGRDTEGPASCGGGRENSVALQVPCRVQTVPVVEE